jgi:two-component system, OmpR family, response regulator
MTPTRREPLRVLIVDDCDDDAELVRIEFELQDVAADCRCVAGRDGTAAALEAFAPQVVLSDLNMPGWSGHEVVALVRERLPGVPVVLLSGAYREGEPLPDADACLLKDDLARVPAVVRGLLGR